MTEDKKLGPFKDGLGCELTVMLHHRGIWKIDKVPGKATVIIVVRNPKRSQQADYSPKHSEVFDGILEAILQAEFDNDLFTFKNGVAGKRRPTEIFKKIKEIENKLNQWKDKAMRAGLTDDNQKSLQMISEPRKTENLKVEEVM